MKNKSARISALVPLFAKTPGTEKAGQAGHVEVWNAKCYTWEPNTTCKESQVIHILINDLIRTEKCNSRTCESRAKRANKMMNSGSGRFLNLLEDEPDCESCSGGSATRHIDQM